MTSRIDPSKPTAVLAYTNTVRVNFQYAKEEIEALQARLDAMEAPPPTAGVTTGFLTEDGSGLFMLEDGSGYLIQEAG